MDTEVKSSEKKPLKIAAVVIMLALALALALFISTPEMRLKLYRGTRITGVSDIRINGVKYSPVEKYSAFGNGQTEEEKQPLVLKKNVFRLEGGRQGEYAIEYFFDNAEIARLTGDDSFNDFPQYTPVRFVYYSDNWWNVVKLSLDADLNGEDGNWWITLKAKCRSQESDGARSFSKQANYISAAENGEGITLLCGGQQTEQ
ncbi:MAG: hypothetical protein IKS19_01385 [Clostridia bacterium]|nr:hypothetical protein [Clostridia bacterium]